VTAFDASDAAAHPFTAFNFEVDIKVDSVSDRVCMATFSECDGLEMSMEPKTIREGGRNAGPVHMVGPVGFGELTLKRGMTANVDLWRWFEAVSAPGGGGLRATADIVVMAADRTVQMQFRLEGLLPVKIKAPALSAKDGQLAIEEMQVAYESLRLL